MTREQQYWEDTQEALSRIFNRCEEIDPQSGYDMLEDIQFVRGFINKHKPQETEVTKSKDRCMFCKEMFDLFCAKSGKNVTYDEFSKPPYKPKWCQGRTPSNDYHD